MTESETMRTINQIGMSVVTNLSTEYKGAMHAVIEKLEAHKDDVGRIEELAERKGEIEGMKQAMEVFELFTQTYMAVADSIDALFPDEKDKT